jgi:hypothetical protein
MGAHPFPVDHLFAAVLSLVPSKTDQVTLLYADVRITLEYHRVRCLLFIPHWGRESPDPSWLNLLSRHAYSILNQAQPDRLFNSK